MRLDHRPLIAIASIFSLVVIDSFFSAKTLAAASMQLSLPSVLALAGFELAAVALGSVALLVSVFFVALFEMQVRRYGERHRVKAGMTGWAQVHGLRGQSSIADRAEWDNYYIENWSLGLDLKILAMTVPAMFSGE